jgi:hypothetical protein
VLVALLVTVTVALGITAPEESVTVPRMVPVGAWAFNAAAIRTNIGRMVFIDVDFPLKAANGNCD